MVLIPGFLIVYDASCWGNFIKYQKNKVYYCYTQLQVKYDYILLKQSNTDDAMAIESKGGTALPISRFLVDLEP